MGAQDFMSQAEGVTVADAFSKAVDKAHHDYGHRGYTGTIAEKDEFVVVQGAPLADDLGKDMANRLIMGDDERISDKWGPAGAVRLTDAEDGKQRWLFFGWASF